MISVHSCRQEWSIVLGRSTPPVADGCDQSESNAVKARGDAGEQMPLFKVESGAHRNSLWLDQTWMRRSLLSVRLTTTENLSRCTIPPPLSSQAGRKIRQQRTQRPFNPQFGVTEITHEIYNEWAHVQIGWAIQGASIDCFWYLRYLLVELLPSSRLLLSTLKMHTARMLRAISMPGWPEAFKAGWPNPRWSHNVFLGYWYRSRKWDLVCTVWSHHRSA